VALAAAAGAPLDDIAHGLFLGPRTARLLQASAMAKLGVESTAELVAVLGPELSPDARVGRPATASPERPAGRRIVPRRPCSGSRGRHFLSKSAADCVGYL
jgi:hypothetical protein